MKKYQIIYYKPHTLQILDGLSGLAAFIHGMNNRECYDAALPAIISSITDTIIKLLP